MCFCCVCCVIEGRELIIVDQFFLLMVLEIVYVMIIVFVIVRLDLWVGLDVSVILLIKELILCVGSK